MKIRCCDECGANTLTWPDSCSRWTNSSVEADLEEPFLNCTMYFHAPHYHSQVMSSHPDPNSSLLAGVNSADTSRSFLSVLAKARAFWERSLASAKTDWKPRHAS